MKIPTAAPVSAASSAACTPTAASHEVGLFLGYPPEDVRGFIENRAQNYKLAGDWKVYGDADRARRIFTQYKICTQCYCKALDAGVSLRQLAVAT